MAIGPVVFDIRYITNEYTKICGLRNLELVAIDYFNPTVSKFYHRIVKQEGKRARF